jgi:hypothetical protein
MKPEDWDLFLKQIAQDYRIQGKLKEIFLVRFAYENWRKPDVEVWELAEAASHETYKKQMTQIYSFFGSDQPQGCPDLDPSSKGPGKFQILREWFKEIKYPAWQKQLVLPASTANGSTGRSLPGDAQVYIPRPPIEADCYQEILKPGALIRIQAPEKMGKTLLLNAILAHAAQVDCRKVYLNFQTAEGPMFNSLDKFLRWFCANISRELGLKPQLEDFWDEELFGSLVSCKTYFQGYILDNMDRSLALGLDNLDRIFAYPEIAKDFLPMLRYWHEEANNLEIWQKLRLVIANSTEVYIKLDANQSPFNVGRQVKLPGFNLEQVKELANYYELNQKPELMGDRFIPELIALVGGHPYLIRLAFAALAQQAIAPHTLLQEAPTQSGIYGPHLRRLWDNLQSSPELGLALQSVIVAPEEAGVQLEPTLAYKLESMGLIHLVGDRAQISCLLYRQYFRSQLLELSRNDESK